MPGPQSVGLGRGEDLGEGLARACAGGECFVFGAGAVASVEIRLVGEGANPVRAPRGRFALVSLQGPAGGPFQIVVSRASDHGAEVWAGELVRATSDGVTLFVFPLPGFAARAPSEVRPAAPAPKSAVAPPAPQSPPKPAEPATQDWAKVALASAAQRRAAEAEREILVPEPGDFVQHFAFGLCEVLMGDDERLKIRDVTGPGRIREIRLDMLRVTGPTDREGKRLFRLERRN